MGVVSPRPDATGMLRRIGKYEVTGQIGQGGFGKVYKAFDPTVGRVVAIKVITTEGDETSVTRFRNEAAAAGNLHHKNVVTIYEFGEHEGVQFLAMEFLDGQDLQQAVAAGRTFTLAEKIDIMYQVADGLLCAHRAGVVHRDIKPANVMLTANGGVKLMDFGIARRAGNVATRLTQTGFLIGTILYMAPEQLRGSPTDELSDIWAYGVMFYELLAGRNPFEAPEPAAVMFKITSETPRAVSEVVPDAPTELGHVLEKLLAKDPDHRYQSLEDVLFDLGPMLSELKRREAVHLLEEAKSLLSQSNTGAATVVIRRVLDLDPANAEARKLRETVQREERRRGFANQAQTIVNKADVELARKNYSQAIELFSNALKLEPNNTEVLSRLEQARKAHENAVRVAELLGDARKNLMKANLTEAVQQASAALNYDPENSEARQLVDKLQQELGERQQQLEMQRILGEARNAMMRRGYAEAIATLVAARERFPHSREVEELLAQAQAGQREREHQVAEEVAQVRKLLSEQRFAEVMPWLERLAREHPRDPQMQQLLAEAQANYQAKQRAEAVEKLARDAWALYKNERFDEALWKIEEGLRQYPNESSLVRLQQAVSRSRDTHEQEKRFRQRLDECHRLRQGRKYSEALAVLGQLIAEKPEEEALRSLDAEIRREHADTERSQTITDALAGANRLLAQGKPDEARRLLDPVAARFPEEAELKHLLEVVQQAQQSQVLQEERTRIQKLLDDALQHELRFDWPAALAAVEAGLKQFPHSAGLKAAAERIRENLRASEKQRTLAAVVQAIEQALGRQDWDTAHAQIEQARRAHPGEGAIDRLASRLEQERRSAELNVRLSAARQRLIAEDFVAARELIERGLRDFPGEQKFAALAEELGRKQQKHAAISAARELLEHHRFDEAEQALGQLPAADPDARGLRETIARERTETQKRERYTAARNQAAGLIQNRDFDRGIALLDQLLKTEFPRDAALERDRQLAITARDEFARQKRLDDEIARIEKIRDRGDAAAVKQAAEALLATEKDARAVQLLRWAEGRIAESELRSRKPNYALIGGLALLLVGAPAVYFLFLKGDPKPVAGSVSVSPSSLSFSFRQGGAQPSAQKIQVGGSGPFRVSASGAWFRATPQSATAPSTLDVAVSTQGLSAGQHSGMISIQPEGGSGSQNVSVALIVEAPPVQRPADPKPTQVTQINPPVTNKPADPKPVVQQPPPQVTNPNPVEPPPVVNTGPDYGSPLGTWRWIGDLPDGARLRIARLQVAEGGGSLTGKSLPGRPVKVDIRPPGLVMEEAPSPGNAYQGMILRNKTGRSVTNIEIKWRKTE